LKAVKATEAVLAVSFIGLSTVSVVFLSTVIASPAVTVIEAVSLGAGLLFIVGGFLSRHLILKAEKHRKIELLADKKLNVISDLVSKALDDETISDEEFSLVLSELDKFFDKKEKIRLEAKSSEESLSRHVSHSFSVPRHVTRRVVYKRASTCLSLFFFLLTCVLVGT